MDFRGGKQTGCFGPLFQTFESFAFSFCIVLLKRSLIILQPQITSSEASDMFVKIKQKIMCKCANRSPSTTLMCKQETI